jgi:hypothetical protein
LDGPRNVVYGYRCYYRDVLAPARDKGAASRQESQDRKERKERVIVAPKGRKASVFKTLILICAVGIDRSACTAANAVDIIHGPPAQTLSQCVHESQTTLAQLSIAPEPGKQYFKVVCSNDQNS